MKEGELFNFFECANFPLEEVPNERIGFSETNNSFLFP